VTFIDDSLQAIRADQIPRVPVLLGGVEDEGTIFAPLYPNVTFFLGAQFGRLSFYRPPNVTELNALYPGLNDTQLLAAVIRDVLFRWCALLFFSRNKGA
jgi:carboxylesterase type B